NCPWTDFTDRAQHRAFADAIQRVAASLPIAVPVVVDGKHRPCDRTADRECPSEPSLIVSKVSLASPRDADDAVRSAYAAWPAWRDLPVQERAAMLERLADRLQV